MFIIKCAFIIGTLISLGLLLREIWVAAMATQEEKKASRQVATYYFLFTIFFGVVAYLVFF